MALGVSFEVFRLDIYDAPFVNIAALALSRGDFTRAHMFYSQAYGVDPENLRTLVGLGVTTFQLEGLDPAMEYFNRAIEIDPEFPDIYFNLALVYARSGRPQDAADNARLALELDPLDSDAYIVYANQMIAAGRRSDAHRFLTATAREYSDLPGLIQALRLLEAQPGD